MKTTIPRVSGFNGEDKRPRFTGNRTASVGVQTGRETMPSGLSAPFPYYGGKSRHAKEIWKRFGSPDVYAEPFAGSLAVLLGRANPCRREVVCDLDGHIANFWRAMQAEPDEVARWADYPTIHQDLTARHRWLIAWVREHSATLSEDPAFYDAPAAGWWAWGKSNWIGNGWCRDGQERNDRMPDVNPRDAGSGRGVHAGRQQIPDGRPATHGHPTGAGVQVGRVDKVPLYVGARASSGIGVQVTRDQIPTVPRDPGGGGVQAQRDQIPNCLSEPGGSGVQANRRATPGTIGSGERLLPWFRALQQRLARVIVLNRSWESAVTPSILSDTASSPDLTRAVFLDPPYPTDKRQGKLYGQDDEGQAATAAYEWAVAHGDRYRIAYCCIPGQFPVPEGWSHWTLKTKGAGSTDLVMFSPCCLPPENRSLF